MANLVSLEAMDVLDRRILAVLQEEGRISNQHLAERVHLSPSACSRRVARLEESGIIEAYAALLNAGAAGKGTTVFVQVTLTRQSRDDMAAFEQAAAGCPDIMECYLMSGEADYLLKIAVSDLADFERVHAQYLSRMPGVARIQSAFVLRTVQRKTAYPL